MKFGQLVEYNLKDLFLEKPSTICGGKNSSRLFSGKIKLGLKFYAVCLCYIYSKLRDIEIR